MVQTVLVLYKIENDCDWSWKQCPSRGSQSRRSVSRNTRSTENKKAEDEEKRKNNGGQRQSRRQQEQ